YLALMAGIAGGAEMVVIPEVPTSPAAVAAELMDAYQRGKPHAIVVVAEGAHCNAQALADHFKQHHERTGFELRMTILGHVQRGGSPTAFDRLLASRLGNGAIELLARGDSGKLVGLIGGKVDFTPLDQVAGRRKPLDLKLFEMANVLAR
ncbi:MAG: 6-phosphofructokinase, partial [Actinobacteria bacterium]|nr:6-phosphofructokinase [Actinomycetota bacterium]